MTTEAPKECRARYDFVPHRVTWRWRLVQYLRALWAVEFPGPTDHRFVRLLPGDPGYEGAAFKTYLVPSQISAGVGFDPPAKGVA